MPNEKTREIVDPFRKLAKRVNDIAKDQGLKLLNFGVNPMLDDSPDRVTIICEFDPDGVKEPEIVIQQANKDLVDAMEEARREEIERKRLKAREDLEDLEKKMGGRQDFLEGFMDD